MQVRLMSDELKHIKLTVNPFPEHCIEREGNYVWIREPSSDYGLSMKVRLRVGDYCFSVLHQGDARIYRIVRIFEIGQDGQQQAELETVLKHDLMPPAREIGNRAKPITRNVVFLVKITVEEIDRRIASLAALRQAIGERG